MRKDKKDVQLDARQILGFDQVGGIRTAVRLGAKVGVVKGGEA